MSARPRPWLAWLRFGLIALIAIAALIWVLRELLSAQAPARKKPAQVMLLPTPAPPPPPPPPKEERKPDPPKAEDKPVPVEPPPQAPPQENEPLKMEGPAGDGLSPFAAGPVTRDYSGGPTGSGSSSGGGRAAYALFTHAMQRSLQEQLNRDRRIKRRDYRIDVRVWLAPAGGIERVELADSTGDTDLDQALVAALRAASLREPPPAGLPQPVRLRVANRGAG